MPKQPTNYNTTLLRLLSTQNIACKDWVIRQYDHEVRAGTVVKPMQGDVRSPTHGDAVVLTPVEGSLRGLALAVSTNPFVTRINPYVGGKTIIDEVCRSITGVGAVPHSLTNCLNFGNPEKPERLGEFRETVKGMGEAAKALSIPIPSGNVSFYNESEISSVLPTATVLGAGIIDDIRKCVTTDFKSAGNPIYLVGKTTPEMGGSAYYRLTGGRSNSVPNADINQLKQYMPLIRKAIGDSQIAACHDISDGGLAVALTESCIGGRLGAEINISGEIGTDAALFSESPTRWIVEVKKSCERKFRDEFDGVIYSQIGTTIGKNKLIIKQNGKKIIDCSLDKLDIAWRRPLWNLMG